jgi:hypothetical protein
LPTDLESVTGFVGRYTIIGLVLLPAARWLTLRYVGKSIDARIDEGVQRRLAEFKAELDERAAILKASLDGEAERVRSALTRGTSDFTIWAQRRHVATADLFAAYLRCESKATDLGEFAFSDSKSMNSASFAMFVGQRPELARIASDIHARYGAGQFEGADELIIEALTEARRSRVIQARNEAYEAYYAHSLYLADSVERAAAAVRDHFHDVVVGYVVGSGSQGERLKNKARLRFLMVEFLNTARADLGKSALSPAPPAKH